MRAKQNERNKDVDDRIRELRRAGWSERRIAAELGITRHRVRTALDGFRLPAPIQGLTWVEEVELHIDRARLRKDDEEQIELGVLAFEVAAWLDERWKPDKVREWQVYDVGQAAVSLRYIVQGVVEGCDPLVRIHAGRARRLVASGST